MSNKTRRSSSDFNKDRRASVGSGLEYSDEESRLLDLELDLAVKVNSNKDAFVKKTNMFQRDAPTTIKGSKLSLRQKLLKKVITSTPMLSAKDKHFFSNTANLSPIQLESAEKNKPEESKSNDSCKIKGKSDNFETSHKLRSKEGKKKATDSRDGAENSKIQKTKKSKKNTSKILQKNPEIKNLSANKSDKNKVLAKLSSSRVDPEFESPPGVARVSHLPLLRSQSAKKADNPKKIKSSFNMSDTELRNLTNKDANLHEKSLRKRDENVRYEDTHKEIDEALKTNKSLKKNKSAVGTNEIQKINVIENGDQVSEDEVINEEKQLEKQNFTPKIINQKTTNNHSALGKKKMDNLHYLVKLIAGRSSMNSNASCSIHLDEENPDFQGIKKINVHSRRSRMVRNTLRNKTTKNHETSIDSDEDQVEKVSKLPNNKTTNTEKSKESRKTISKDVQTSFNSKGAGRKPKHANKTVTKDVQTSLTSESSIIPHSALPNETSIKDVQTSLNHEQSKQASKIATKDIQTSFNSKGAGRKPKQANKTVSKDVQTTLISESPIIKHSTLPNETSTKDMQMTLNNKHLKQSSITATKDIQTSFNSKGAGRKKPPNITVTKDIETSLTSEDGQDIMSPSKRLSKNSKSTWNITPGNKSNLSNPIDEAKMSAKKPTSNNKTLPTTSTLKKTNVNLPIRKKLARNIFAAPDLPDLHQGTVLAKKALKYNPQFIPQLKLFDKNGQALDSSETLSDAEEEPLTKEQAHANFFKKVSLLASNNISLWSSDDSDEEDAEIRPEKELPWRLDAKSCSNEPQLHFKANSLQESPDHYSGSGLISPADQARSNNTSRRIISDILSVENIQLSAKKKERLISLLNKSQKLTPDTGKSPGNKRNKNQGTSPNKKIRSFHADSDQENNEPSKGRNSNISEYPLGKSSGNKRNKNQGTSPNKKIRSFHADSDQENNEPSNTSEYSLRKSPGNKRNKNQESSPNKTIPSLHADSDQENVSNVSIRNNRKNQSILPHEFVKPKTPKKRGRKKKVLGIIINEKPSSNSEIESEGVRKSSRERRQVPDRMNYDLLQLYLPDSSIQSTKDSSSVSSSNTKSIVTTSVSSSTNLNETRDSSSFISSISKPLLALPKSPNGHSECIAEVSGVRKRGRPAKTQKKAPPEANNNSRVERKRGRPPAQEQVSNSGPPEDDNDSPVERKRGRPPGKKLGKPHGTKIKATNETLPEETTLKGKRGRPPVTKANKSPPALTNISNSQVVEEREDVQEERSYDHGDYTDSGVGSLSKNQMTSSDVVSKMLSRVEENGESSSSQAISNKREIYHFVRKYLSRNDQTSSSCFADGDVPDQEGVFGQIGYENKADMGYLKLNTNGVKYSRKNFGCKMFYVIKGRAMVQIDQEIRNVTEHNFFAVPSESHYIIKNTSLDNSLLLLYSKINL